MSKDAYYFSHDSNARNDLRMVRLRRVKGLAGVGLFWCVVEMLREAINYELPMSTMSEICYELRCDEDDFLELFRCELLHEKGDVFYSKSLKDRMQHLDTVRIKRAIAGQKGGNSKANAKQMLSNKSKVKESKVNKRKVFIKPSIDEVRKYCKERNNSVNVNKWMAHYEANGWMVGKNKMKDWKAAVRTWENSEFSQPKVHDRTKTEGAPVNFGVPSPTAVPMPDSLKKKIQRIGK